MEQHICAALHTGHLATAAAQILSHLLQIKHPTQASLMGSGRTMSLKPSHQGLGEEASGCTASEWGNDASSHGLAPN